MAKGAALYITYIQGQSKTDQLAFFKAIGGRMGQCRSLAVTTGEWKHCCANLEATVPSRLEKLHLSGGRYSMGPVKFFGGAAAPPGLKDVRLESIPIAVTPLKLACLTRLHLSDIEDVSAPELLRILSDSPSLETLSLVSMEDLDHNTAPRLPPIQLLSLSQVILLDLSVTFIHFVLSAITAPCLQEMVIDCDMEGIPSSQLLNGDLAHLSPTLSSAVSTASEIRVNFRRKFAYEIQVGGLEIALAHKSTLRHMQDTLEWLGNHVGVHLNKLPFHLYISNCKPNLESLEWFTSKVVVTKLTLLSSSFSSMPEFKMDIEEIVPLLSHRKSSSRDSWYLPCVEVLVTNMVRPSGNPDIVEMIERRHSANREQREGSGVPKRFREIWLSQGRHTGQNTSKPNVEFLKAVKTAGGSADVYWEAKKWTSAGLE
ncbi:hypothetical protein FRC04_011614 [Tulasnella sp. 424]|nr:hypothetical protein FRC04_011614 [Tulasnella sp. 424]KAG8967196.1 hypothetical protein FRC05_002271 [Tulasnella sp. 425]